jgi:hypothetical protein
LVATDRLRLSVLVKVSGNTDGDLVSVPTELEKESQSGVIDWTRDAIHPAIQSLRWSNLDSRKLDHNR